MPEAAAALLEPARGADLVALGGGRVIDTAKAVAAVTGAAVAAIPTTMSGAEMTGIHRLPAGAEERAEGLVRPVLVIADPEAMTSQPEAELRASSMNALAHGADSLYTPLRQPGLADGRAARRRADRRRRSTRTRAERDRAALALGSILCGYAIDSALFALHHVICQTLVRVCGSPHAETNAAILPPGHGRHARRARREQIGALARGDRDRPPRSIEARILELGGDPPGSAPRAATARRARGGARRDRGPPGAADSRPEPPGRDELRQLIESAW